MSSTSTQSRPDTTTYDKSIHLTESEKQILEQFVAWLYEMGPEPDNLPRETLLKNFYTWRADWWMTQTTP